MHYSANPDQEMEDLKKEVAKPRSQIEAISVHHPQTNAILETLEITAQDIQEKIAPLVELPQTNEKIKKEVATGFKTNQTQLANITALLQTTRPLAKLPDKQATNTTTKARK
jgi:hypothetical protein